MIRAYLKGAKFLEDVESVVSVRPEALHAWWLGQSGFLVAAGGKRVLFDPYLSDSLTRKYAGTGKEHVRMSELVVHPGDLRDIDLVTSSHAHTDHLDAETLRPLFQTNPRMCMVYPAAERELVEERVERNIAEDENFVGMDAGVEALIGDLTVTGVPAAHNEVEKDGDGRCRFLGYIVRMGNWTVYHSGDTRPVPGLADLLRPHRIDLAFLPINGYLEERRVAGNLWGQEAAALADNAGISCVVPCHYDLFTFNTETPQAFIEACERRGQKYQVLRGGERVTIGGKE